MTQQGQIKPCRPDGSTPTPPMQDAITRIEHKLDTLTTIVQQLLNLLAVEDEEQPELTLDGEPAGHERDQNQGL